MSREDLVRHLQNLEAAAASDEYGGTLRERARVQAEAVRTRLQNGDFRVGDRIAVQVQGENWNAQSPGAVAPTVVTMPGAAGVPVISAVGNTGGAVFTVESGPAVKLPGIPAISLKGVLRSELTDHLTRELSTYILDPQVTSRALIRVSVFGAVGSPGYFYPAAEQLVGEVIMMAGGPAPSADNEKIMVRRGADLLWEGESLQAVMAEGRTLDQMNFQAGDIIEVPAKSTSNVWVEVGRYAVIIGSTLLLGIRVF